MYNYVSKIIAQINFRLSKDNSRCEYALSLLTLAHWYLRLWYCNSYNIHVGIKFGWLYYFSDTIIRFYHYDISNVNVLISLIGINTYVIETVLPRIIPICNHY